MTDEKTDLDYARDAAISYAGVGTEGIGLGDLTFQERENTAQTHALLSIAGSLARLVELVEEEVERTEAWQEAAERASGAPVGPNWHELYLSHMETMHGAQGAGQPLPPEVWPGTHDPVDAVHDAGWPPQQSDEM